MDVTLDDDFNILANITCPNPQGQPPSSSTVPGPLRPLNQDRPRPSDPVEPVIQRAPDRFPAEAEPRTHTFLVQYGPHALGSSSLSFSEHGGNMGTGGVSTRYRIGGFALSQYRKLPRGRPLPQALPDDTSMTCASPRLPHWLTRLFPTYRAQIWRLTGPSRTSPRGELAIQIFCVVSNKAE